MFGVTSTGMLFRDGRSGPHFLSRGCFIFVVGVNSRSAIWGGEYKRLIRPCRFPINVEWYREDGCVFVAWISSVKLIWDDSIFSALGELCRCKGVLHPLVYTVDGVVE